MRAFCYRPLLALLLLLVPVTAAPAPAADTPLIAAVKHGDLAKLRTLLKNAPQGAVTRTFFYAVVANAKPAIVSLLLQRGADVNGQLVANHATALHYAAEVSTPAIVALLLKHGANVDAVDNHLDTPLNWAAQGGKLANARYLLAHGANGPAALVYQTYEGDAVGVSTLLNAGVNVNARSDRKDFKGMTPLIEAASANNIALVRLLLGRGADVSAVQPGDNNITTALMFAAFNCNADMISLLAAHGARDDVRANDSNAYDLAHSGGTASMHPCGSDVLDALSNLH